MNPAKIYNSSLRPPSMIEELWGLIRYKDLVSQLISKGIKTRYKRSFLGVAWTMLQPLLTMIVLTLVFSSIFRFSNSDYALYVLSGIIVWGFFAQSTTAATGDLLWSGGLVSKVPVPKSVFAVSADGTDLSHEIPSELTIGLLNSIEGTFSRLWYVSSSDNPGYGLQTETKWLDARFPLRTQRLFDGDTVEVEAGLYDLPLSRDS